ncbi:MAG: hypothetical protein GY862_33755 [Gammaproteobacteria bacterium]|nr:hypothetical protein [Gammaproteobacteria bacterium]
MSEERVFFIDFKFRRDFLEKGGNPLALFLELQRLGKITVIPHTAAVPPLEECEPKLLYIHWTIKLAARGSLSAIEESLMSLIADSENNIAIEEISLPPPDPMLPAASETEKRRGAKPSETNAANIQEAAPVASKNMLVRVGMNIFSIDESLVVESIPQVRTLDEQDERVACQGDHIPVLRLRRIFHIHSKAGKPAVGVVVKHGKQRLCLLADEILRQRHALPHAVKENFAQLPGIAGASILDNGEIAFALDIPRILN